MKSMFAPHPYRQEGVLSNRSGWAVGLRLCVSHISETTGWIFSILSSLGLSTPEVVQHGRLTIFPMSLNSLYHWSPDIAEPMHLNLLDRSIPFMTICPIWACQRAKNLSNLVPDGSRFCGMHISDTTGQMLSIRRSFELSRPVVVPR